MPSLRSTVFAVAAAFVATARADYYIDPESVPLGTRGESPDPFSARAWTDNGLENWCENEKDTCPLICQQVEHRTTLVNECDPVCYTSI